MGGQVLVEKNRSTALYKGSEVTKGVALVVGPTERRCITEFCDQ
jgi:hypothetical protein